MTGLVRIEIDGDAARVYAPLSARPHIKTMPKRRWDPTLHCWLIPAEHADEMRRRLSGARYTVRVIHPDRPRPPLRLPDTCRDERKEPHP